MTALHEYLDKDEVYPGDVVRAHIWLIAPELLIGRLFPGFEFSFQEGVRTTGHGRVVTVRNRDLAVPNP